MNRQIDMPKNVTIADLSDFIVKRGQNQNLQKIVRAYYFAEKAHGDQKRSSGEPYIVHPLSVAWILVDLGMDTDTVCAGLLHDVVEDTEHSMEDLRRLFGLDTALLVDGVTKMIRVKFQDKEQQQAENFCKVLLSMSQDIRVMIIKLADRLHNIRTLGFLPVEKQLRIAKETLDVYVPIAEQLGIWQLKEEMQNTAFRYMDPYAYQEIERIMEQTVEEGGAFIQSVIDMLYKRMEDEPFKRKPEISGRVKSFYSIYKKIYTKHKDFNEIYDKFAIRIIVDDQNECYIAMGIVNNMFTPLPNRYKDYIAMPKPNKYRSLHTTVLANNGILFEVQIRTHEMHMEAEYGIAAHWKYKMGVKGEQGIEEWVAQVRRIMEVQQTADDREEFIKSLRNDTALNMTVLTPKGKPIFLPIGANIIDFAYRIHTEIGHKMIGAKINGKMAPIETELQNGQVCEIITTKDFDKGPSRAWLGLVKTGEAKSKIRSWFKKERREENIVEGRESLEREFRRNGIRLTDAERKDFLADDLKRYSCNTMEDFFASIGYGGISLNRVLPRLKAKYDKMCESRTTAEPVAVAAAPTEQNSIPITLKTDEKEDIILIDDLNGCLFKPAQCCNPLPGDPVIGFITRGHGISIHTKNCVNYRSALKRNNREELQRWKQVRWSDSAANVMIKTTIEVIATDRVGLVFDISKVLAESRILIAHSNSRMLRNGNAIFEATVQVGGTDQLQNLMDKIRKINGVLSVDRARK